MATVRGRKFDNRLFLAALQAQDDARKEALTRRIFGLDRPVRPGSATELARKIDRLIELLEKSDKEQE